MKIKNFICRSICEKGLAEIEKEVNDFIAQHHVDDIKITSTTNNFGNIVVIYTVLYR